MPAILQDFLITKEEIRLITDVPSLQALPPSILDKINKASILLRSSYMIDKTKYDNVFVTSDIHCDLLKLDHMLSSLGLVNANTVKGSLAEKIPNIEWIPKRTLLVIVGDIVDGRRSNESQIPDPTGNVELMLHAYLYNLRLKARERDSELVFTIGNHDYHTVISNSPADENMSYMFVHDSAKRFFITNDGRKNCLRPFYNSCPYVMIDLGSEIAFIHGGFLGYDSIEKKFVNNTNRVKEIQKNIDLLNNFTGLTPADHDFLSNAGDGQREGYEYSPLWSRAYAALPAASICNTISHFYKMIVVGHCQMAFDCGRKGAHSAEILETEPYTKHNCGGTNGCVVVGCDSVNGPQLAFVDIGFSRAFSGFLQGRLTLANELNRRAEMLHLVHNPAADISDRYYNMIIRENASNTNKPEIMWAALESEANKKVKKIKFDAFIQGLEYVRKPEYEYKDERFGRFQDALWEEKYKAIVNNEPAFSKGPVKQELKKYIENDLFVETFGFNNNDYPTPLHFIAIDKNLRYLQLFLTRVSYTIDYLFRALPPLNAKSADVYDRYKSIGLSKYANMDFLGIINTQIKNSAPKETKILYEIKVTFIEALSRLHVGNGKLRQVLEFNNPTVPTILHYDVINNHHPKLFDTIISLNPPMKWLDARLPKEGSSFYTKFSGLIPEIYENKTARGIIDIMLDSGSYNTSMLMNKKRQLLGHSAKPKTVRGLFRIKLAKQENEPYISNVWRQRLLKKGGTRKIKAF